MGLKVEAGGSLKYFLIPLSVQIESGIDILA